MLSVTEDKPSGFLGFAFRKWNYTPHSQLLLNGYNPVRVRLTSSTLSFVACASLFCSNAALFVGQPGSWFACALLCLKLRAIAFEVRLVTLDVLVHAEMSVQRSAAVLALRWSERMRSVLYFDNIKGILHPKLKIHPTATHLVDGGSFSWHFLIHGIICLHATSTFYTH